MSDDLVNSFLGEIFGFKRTEDLTYNSGILKM